MYDLHLAFAYVLVALTCFTLLVKIIKSPNIYKPVYYYILICFSLTIIGDGLWIFTDFPIDFSIIFYGITAICLSVCSVRITPKQLLYKQLNEVVSNMIDGVQLFDIDGDYIFRNQAMIDMVEKYKKLGLNPDGPFNSLRSGDAYKKLKNLPDRDFDEEVPKNGKIYTFHISTHCLRDSKDKFLGAFIIVHDKTKEVEKINQELFNATHDELTNIPNQKAFTNMAQQVLVNNPDEQYLVMCSDIDNFKMVNDNFGRQTGDDLLGRVAHALQQYTKPNEVYGRLGGDKFILLMKKEDFKEEIFIRYSNQIAYISEDLFYPITFHFGVYEVEDTTMPISSMIDRAFMAVETIKGNLQEKIAYYDNSLRESVIREQKIIGEFPMALVSDQFKMYLQPQVTTQGTVHGAEALVRWEHMSEGLIPPHKFIPILEKNGLITQLDLYIWNLAAQKLHEWKERGLDDYYISVNISPRDFLHVDIYKTFVELVEKYEINPKNLKLEITESSIMLNFEAQLQLINKLKGYGFLIEMDDFGSGYSSLNLLKDIPFDILKIDMEFLHETRNTERSISILNSIIKMSKNLNMPVITEGVETLEQVNFLKEMGTDYYQGFYFDKPMPVESFEAKYIGK